MDINKFIGEKITYYRKLNNLTIEELASKTNISASTITKYEQNQMQINSGKLNKIARSFDLEIDHFYPNNHDIDDYQREKITFSENLLYYLQLNGITRKQFSVDLNYRYATVLDWLNANTYPRAEKITEICKYFNISKSDLTESKRKINQNKKKLLIYTITSKLEKKELNEKHLHKIIRMIDTYITEIK